MDIPLTGREMPIKAEQLSPRSPLVSQHESVNMPPTFSNEVTETQEPTADRPETPELARPTISPGKRTFEESRKPDILTTEESIIGLLKQKHGSPLIDEGDMSRLQNASENFGFTLVQAVIENHRKRQAEHGTKSSKRYVPRVTVEDIWRALATTPSLRPIALRFVQAQLIPVQYLSLFENLAVEDKKLNQDEESSEEHIQDEDDFESDSDCNEVINPLLFG